MAEKYLRTSLARQKGYDYEVYYGNCVLMRGTSESGRPIYWFSFSSAEEMRKTWQEYEYFVDDEGDISRRPR